MFKFKLSASMIFPALILMACAGNTADLQTNIFSTDNYLKSPAEVSQLLQDSSFTAGLQILDVRTPEEFQVSCLKGAQDIDIRVDDFNQKIANLDKTAKYLVYCRSGNRSADAVARMKKIGINNIVEVAGGISAWENSGLPTESNCS